MTILFAKTTHALQPGQTLSGVAQHAQIVAVEHGLVWLTIEGSPDDYWLAAGGTLTIEPERLVVVEAQAESRLRLQAAPQARHIPGKGISVPLRICT
jgi:hypothetical protein